MSYFTVASTFPIAIEYDHVVTNVVHGAGYSYAIILRDGGALTARAERVASEILAGVYDSGTVREFVGRIKNLVAIQVPDYEDTVSFDIEDISVPRRGTSLLHIGAPKYVIERKSKNSSLTQYRTGECIVSFGRRA